MGFLRAELAQHVAAERIGKERLAGAPEDRDEPRQHQHQRPYQAPDRAQPPQPCRRTVEDCERQNSKADEHQDQRALEQDTAGERRPEHRRHRPGRALRIFAALPGQIDPRHRPHRGDDRQQQHCVRLGEPGFGAEQDGTAHHQRRQRGPAPCDEGKRRPVGEQHRADGADQRGNSIEPNPQLRPRQAERRGGFHHRRLHPIDANRLLVADVVLEADVDEIAALDHLLGRLREPRLVAVDRRNIEETGQEQNDAAEHQEYDGAKMVCCREVERHGQPAAGMRRFYRLLARSKAWGLVGFNHLARIRRNRTANNTTIPPYPTARGRFFLTVPGSQRYRPPRSHRSRSAGQNPARAGPPAADAGCRFHPRKSRSASRSAAARRPRP